MKVHIENRSYEILLSGSKETRIPINELKKVVKNALLNYYKEHEIPTKSVSFNMYRNYNED